MPPETIPRESEPTIFKREESPKLEKPPSLALEIEQFEREKEDEFELAKTIVDSIKPAFEPAPEEDIPDIKEDLDNMTPEELYNHLWYTTYDEINLYKDTSSSLKETLERKAKEIKALKQDNPNIVSSLRKYYQDVPDTIIQLSRLKAKYNKLGKHRAKVHELYRQKLLQKNNFKSFREAKTRKQQVKSELAKLTKGPLSKFRHKHKINALKIELEDIREVLLEEKPRKPDKFNSSDNESITNACDKLTKEALGKLFTHSFKDFISRREAEQLPDNRSSDFSKEQLRNIEQDFINQTLFGEIDLRKQKLERIIDHPDPRHEWAETPKDKTGWAKENLSAYKNEPALLLAKQETSEALHIPANLVTDKFFKDLPDNLKEVALSSYNQTRKAKKELPATISRLVNLEKTIKYKIAQQNIAKIRNYINESSPKESLTKSNFRSKFSKENKTITNSTTISDIYYGIDISILPSIDRLEELSKIIPPEVTSYIKDNFIKDKPDFVSENIRAMKKKEGFVTFQHNEKKREDFITLLKEKYITDSQDIARTYLKLLQTGDTHNAHKKESLSYSEQIAYSYSKEDLKKYGLGKIPGLAELMTQIKDNPYFDITPETDDEYLKMTLHLIETGNSDDLLSATDYLFRTHRLSGFKEAIITAFDNRVNKNMQVGKKLAPDFIEAIGKTIAYRDDTDKIKTYEILATITKSEDIVATRAGLESMNKILDKAFSQDDNYIDFLKIFNDTLLKIATGSNASPSNDEIRTEIAKTQMVAGYLSQFTPQETSAITSALESRIEIVFLEDRDNLESNSRSIQNLLQQIMVNTPSPKSEVLLFKLFEASPPTDQQLKTFTELISTLNNKYSDPKHKTEYTRIREKFSNFLENKLDTNDISQLKFDLKYTKFLLPADQDKLLTQIETTIKTDYDKFIENPHELSQLLITTTTEFNRPESAKILMDLAEKDTNIRNSAIQNFTLKDYQIFLPKDSFKILEQGISKYPDALTGSENDKVTPYLRDISTKAKTFSLSKSGLADFTSFIKEFGLERTPALYDYYSNIQKLSRGEIDALPDNQLEAGITSIDTLKAAQQTMREAIITSKLPPPEQMSPLEYDLLATETMFHTSRWARAHKDLKQMYEQFTQDEQSPDFVKLPKGYTDLRLKIDRISLELETLNSSQQEYTKYRNDVLGAEKIKKEGLTNLTESITTALTNEINALDFTGPEGKVKFMRRKEGILRQAMDSVSTADNPDLVLKELLGLEAKLKIKKENKFTTPFMRQILYYKVMENYSGYEELPFQMTREEAVNLDGLQYVRDITANAIKDHVLNSEDKNKHFSEAFTPSKADFKKMRKIFPQAEIDRVLLSVEGSTEDVREEIALIPNRSFIGELSGYFGEACYTNINRMLDTWPNVTAGTLVANPDSEEEREIMGSVLFIETTTAKDEPAIVVRATNPRDSYLKKLQAKSFCEQVFDAAAKYAKARNIPKVLVSGASGTVSNRLKINDYVGGITSPSNLVPLKDSLDFNSYEIQNSCHLVREVE